MVSVLAQLYFFLSFYFYKTSTCLIGRSALSILQFNITKKRLNILTSQILLQLDANPEQLSS